MIASDLASINTVTVDMVGGDRIIRQGSTSKRVFTVKVAGVATTIAFVTTLNCQVRDAENNLLAMTPTVALEAGTGQFSLTFTDVATEAVTPEAGFTFAQETINDREWLVFTGVFDVELGVTGPTIIGCPVQGKIKMKRGVTR